MVIRPFWFKNLLNSAFSLPQRRCDEQGCGAAPDLSDRVNELSLHVFWSSGGPDAVHIRRAPAHQETGHLRWTVGPGPLQAHWRHADQLSQDKRVSKQTHTRTRAWTVVTFVHICRSGELIQKAFMNNDFMKHLEHGQVRTEPPC